MPNVITAYDETFYAQEALILVEKALGLAARVHRGYDATPQLQGSTIQIRKPSTFTAQDAPGSDQSLAAQYVSIPLNYWREVKFGLTDKELSLTRDALIQEHIRPAAYALADDIDQKLAALYKDIPWYFDVAGGAGSTLVLADVAGARKVMRDNAVPDLNDPSQVHLMVGSAEEAALLPLLAPFNTSGASGQETLRRGTLGSLFGMEIFANQNTPTHTPGVAADSAGTLTGAHAAGLSAIVVGAVTAAGTFKKGDTLVIAGNTQRYAITADATADGGGAVTLNITPKLVQAYGNGVVVTIRLDSHVSNMAFHRAAFALAMAPLSAMGNELGARIATVSSPESNITLRSRVWYDGNASAVKVGLDVLYGFITLDPNLATRLCG